MILLLNVILKANHTLCASQIYCNNLEVLIQIKQQ